MAKKKEKNHKICREIIKNVETRTKLSKIYKNHEQY